MTLLEQYKDRECTLDDFVKDNIEEVTPTAVKDYFFYLKRNYPRAMRIEGPCITACELGELGTLSLFQSITSSVAWQQAGSMAVGAICGGTLATMAYIGEVYETEIAHEHHEHTEVCKHKQATPTPDTKHDYQKHQPCEHDHKHENCEDHKHEHCNLESKACAHDHSKDEHPHDVHRDCSHGHEHGKKEKKPGFFRQFKLMYTSMGKGFKHVYRIMKHGDKKEKSQLYTQLKSASVSALFAEIFGCIGAAEFTELGVAALLGGTALTFSNPLFWAIWGGAMIPAYFLGSLAVATKMAGDNYMDQRTLLEMKVKEGDFSRMYEDISKEYCNVVKVDQRRFYVELEHKDSIKERIYFDKTNVSKDEIRKAYHTEKGRVRSIYRAIKDAVLRKPFNLLNKGSEQVKIHCKTLKRDDERKELYRHAIHEILEKNNYKIELYVQRKCCGA